MMERSALGLEHAVRCEEAEGAVEGIRVRADFYGQISGCSGCVVQSIGDTEICDNVKAPRQTVSARDLKY